MILESFKKKICFFDLGSCDILALLEYTCEIISELWIYWSTPKISVPFYVVYIDSVKLCNYKCALFCVYCLSVDSYEYIVPSFHSVTGINRPAHQAVT